MRRIRVPLLPRWLRWSVVLLVAAVVFYASVLLEPGDQPRELLGPYWDAQLHVVAYAVFALMLAYATANWRDLPYRRTIVVLAVSFGYGVLIEAAQAAVPYRHFSYGDMLANAGGALLVVGWFVVETRVRYRRVAVTGPVLDPLRGREE